MKRFKIIGTCFDLPLEVYGVKSREKSMILVNGFAICTLIIIFVNQ